MFSLSPADGLGGLIVLIVIALERNERKTGNFFAIATERQRKVRRKSAVNLRLRVFTHPSLPVRWKKQFVNGPCAAHMLRQLTHTKLSLPPHLSNHARFGCSKNRPAPVLYIAPTPPARRSGRGRHVALPTGRHVPCRPAQKQLTWVRMSNICFRNPYGPYLISNFKQLHPVWEFQELSHKFEVELHGLRRPPFYGGRLVSTPSPHAIEDFVDAVFLRAPHRTRETLREPKCQREASGW